MSSEWSIRFSNTRKLPYFYNNSSGQSTWELPEGLSESQAMNLPGAHYLSQSSSASASASTSASTSGDKQEDGKVRASHLLIKSRESRRPSSWKEANVTRSKQEAEAILKNHIHTLGPNPTPEQFAQVASVHSDCSSAQRGGDLGFFTRGQMQKPFEDSTFNLAVGQMSGIVSTDSGSHVILRTA